MQDRRRKKRPHPQAGIEPGGLSLIPPLPNPLSHGGSYWDKLGYSDTVIEGADLIAYHDHIYIPHALQEHIVEWYHSMLGHPGEKCTVATITQHLIWPKIHEQVATHVSKCKACQLYKGTKEKGGTPTSEGCGSTPLADTMC
jgi:hypothetical protein